MRIWFHPVLVPHRKLPVGKARTVPPTALVPSPYFVRIQKIQLPFQLATDKFPQVADKVAVDIVRMLFILRKRSIDKDVPNADFPKLASKERQVVN